MEQNENNFAPVHGGDWTHNLPCTSLPLRIPSGKGHQEGHRQGHPKVSIIGWVLTDNTQQIMSTLMGYHPSIKRSSSDEYL